MKVGVYNLIIDPLPVLNLIKNIEAAEDTFEYIPSIVEILNKELLLDKLDSEHIYAVSLTFGLKPRGIIEVAVGDNKECLSNLRGLAIGLLLTGAEQFIVFHNHPGGNKEPSTFDYERTDDYDTLGDIIGIKFNDHFLVTKGHYKSCKRDLDYIPFV